MTYMSGYTTHDMDRSTWLAAGRALDGRVIYAPKGRDYFGSDHWLLTRAEMLRPWYPGEAGAVLKSRAARFVRELLPVEIAEELAYEVEAETAERERHRADVLARRGARA